MGALLIRACLPLLVHALPPIRDRGAVLQPLAVHIGIDLRVLGFTFGLSLLTAIVFGIVPALRATRVDLTPSLKDTGRARLAVDVYRRIAARWPGDAAVYHDLAVAAAALSSVY